jgi:hypothetical protein
LQNSFNSTETNFCCVVVFVVVGGGGFGGCGDGNDGGGAGGAVVVSVAVSVLLLMVVVVMLALVGFPVLLNFVSKNYFIKCLSHSRKLRGRLLELHSPKVITVP